MTSSGRHFAADKLMLRIGAQNITGATLKLGL
jgi:hypothetical protein